jgi:hypothetical protein
MPPSRQDDGTRRRPRAWSRQIPGLGVLVLLAGCGSDLGSEGSPSAENRPASVGLGTCTTTLGHTCPGDVRALVPGVMAETERTAQAVQMEFLESAPAPVAKGYNSFRVRLLDMQGAAYEPGSVSSLPWMPDHRHGTNVAPSIRRDEATNEWVLENVNLFMGGYWKLYVFSCDGVEANCCEAGTASCAESSRSLRDTLFLETWIYD